MPNVHGIQTYAALNRIRQDPRQRHTKQHTRLNSNRVGLTAAGRRMIC